MGSAPSSRAWHRSVRRGLLRDRPASAASWRSAMTAARSVAVDPHSVRQVARETFAARPARQQASRQARIELKARLPEEYAARYQTELTLIQPIEPPAAGVIDRRTAAVARLRALVWLADLYPDLTRQRLHAEPARLPIDPANRVPGRRRALAWVRALDGLRAVYPEQFQARYLIELAHQVD